MLTQTMSLLRDGGIELVHYTTTVHVLVSQTTTTNTTLSRATEMWTRGRCFQSPCRTVITSYTRSTINTVCSCPRHASLGWEVAEMKRIGARCRMFLFVQHQSSDLSLFTSTAGKYPVSTSSILELYDEHDMYTRSTV